MDNKSAPSNRKILRSSSAKRRTKTIPIADKTSLERVLGLTLQCNAALDVNTDTGVVAYPAGCVVVLYNPKKNKQSHIVNSSKKTITSLAFSGDGKHLVTGECGHQPCVRVWDVEERVQVAEFKGHKFGINCVTFSPNLKYIVSIGSQHDMIVNVWNWRTSTKVASNKIACKVNAVAFSEDGNMFVTVGSRHVKFWYLEASKSKIKTETLPLMGRSGILGEQKNNHFCDVACGRGEMAESTYVITQSGLLCEFNAKRLLDKWVELRTDKASSISVGEEYIFVGCSDGIIRVFDAFSLHFVTTMPRPHYLGVDVAAGLHPSDMIPPNDEAKLPDTIAVAFDDASKKVICVYNDHSLYVWDVHDIKRIGKAASFLYHSSSIWGLDMYPKLTGGLKQALPPGSFITCAGDDTIRIWNLDNHMSTDTLYRRNIYSNELLKIMYTDPNISNLCNDAYTPAGGAEKTDTSDSKSGVRCIQVSPDGQHIASGDRAGNVRVHELHMCGQLHQIEAHDSEVLCLQYSKANKSKELPLLLASTSRDRLLHIFDVEQNYGLLQTLDDHSSSITAVKFTDTDDQFQMLSCGADKSLLFRTAQLSPEFQFVRMHHLVGKATLYDMDVDPSNKFVATACQDRNIRIYNTRTTKMKKLYKGSQSDDGSVIKIQLDPSGSYVATSASDKSVNIYDFYTGDCMATAFGHSEVVTGVKFTNDLKHLISTSGDGCIFIWRLSLDLTEHMVQRLEDLEEGPKQPVSTQEIRRETFVSVPSAVTLRKSPVKGPQEETDFPVHSRNIPDPKVDVTDGQPPAEQPEAPAGYKFSIGQLPSWAKKQIGLSDVEKRQPGESSSQPRGRWAQRTDSIKVMSVLDESSIHVSPNSPDKRRYSLEDSQLLRRDTMVLVEPNKKLNIPVITDADDLVDDDDEDEFVPMTSSRELLYKEDDKMSPSNDNKTFVTSRSSSLPPEVLRTPSYEEDADTQTEVIYLPSDDDYDSDENTNTFQVYELPVNKCELRRTTRKMSDVSDNASQKDDSESAGFDEDEDEMESTPGTPMVETPDKENFLKQNFENLGTSPDLAAEKFDNTLDNLEQQMRQYQGASHRLSLSSRFLSRAQSSQLRSVAAYNSAIQNRKNASDHRTPNSPVGEVQKRKDEMARAVDDTRRRLQSLGWKANNKSDDNIPVKDVNSPKREECREFPVQKRSPGRQSGNSSQFNSPSRMRRCWSMVDVSKTPVSRYDTPSRRSMGDSLASPRFDHKPDCSLVPSDTNTTIASVRSRSVQNLSTLDVENEPPPPPGKKATRRLKSYEKQTTSSSAKLLKSSSGTALNKTGTDSAERQDKPTARRFRKGRLSNAQRSQWQSSPNLATQIEEETESDISKSLVNDASVRSRADDRRKSQETTSVSKAKEQRSRSNSPGLNNAEKLPSQRKLRKSKSKEDMCSSSDSLASIPSIASDSPRASEERALSPPSQKSSNHCQEEVDRKAMPPPSSFPKFLQKARQTKRKSDDLTLSQAKEILMGKSSIYSKEKEHQRPQHIPKDTVVETKTSELLIADLDELPVKESSPLKGFTRVSTGGRQAVNPAEPVTIVVAQSEKKNAVKHSTLQSDLSASSQPKAELASCDVKPLHKRLSASCTDLYTTEGTRRRQSPRAAPIPSLQESRNKSLDASQRLQELLMQANNLTQRTTPSPPDSARSSGSSRDSSTRKDVSAAPSSVASDNSTAGTIELTPGGEQLNESVSLVDAVASAGSVASGNSAINNADNYVNGGKHISQVEKEMVSADNKNAITDAEKSISALKTVLHTNSGDNEGKEFVGPENRIIIKSSGKPVNKGKATMQAVNGKVVGTDGAEKPFVGESRRRVNITVSLVNDKLKDSVVSNKETAEVSQDGDAKPHANSVNSENPPTNETISAGSTKTKPYRTLPRTSDRKSGVSIKDLVQKPTKQTHTDGQHSSRILTNVRDKLEVDAAPSIVTRAVHKIEAKTLEHHGTPDCAEDETRDFVLVKSRNSSEVMLMKEETKSQAGTATKADRSSLTLDLSPEAVMVSEQCVSSECEAAVDSLKCAVETISQVFTKLAQTPGEDGKDTTSMRALMKESLNDAIDSLKSLRDKNNLEPRVANTLPEAPSDHPWMEPLFEQYSQQLTDRVYKLLQAKLDGSK